MSNSNSNLFNWEYQFGDVLNLDNSPSNFKIVYGEGGKVVHCKKDSYSVIPTFKVSELAQDFNGSVFSHHRGEVIGFDFLIGTKPTKVGDINYRGVFKMPNNGTGAGYLSLFEKRLICKNGATREANLGAQKIRIAHDFSYEQRMDLLKTSLTILEAETTKAISMNESLNEIIIDRSELMLRLNKWFFDVELANVSKGDLDFNSFRELLYTDPEKTPSYSRYQELTGAMNREIGYNGQLGLKLSAYTVYATVSNYLSRRIEKSTSKVLNVIQFERQSEKLRSLEVAL